MPKTTIVSEMTENEARDTVVVTKAEAAALVTCVAGLRSQLETLDQIMSSAGITGYIPSKSPRSLANLQFTIKQD